MDPEELIQAYLEGKLSPEDAGPLNDWLRASPENLDRFLHQVDMHLALHATPAPRVGRRWKRLVAAAAAVLVVGAGLAYWGSGSPDVARLEEARGKVYLLLTDGEKVLVTAPKGLRAGQGIETEGPQSSALLRYPDSTRIDVGPATMLRAIDENAEGGKKAHVARGAVAADVSRQPEGRPMVFTTPQGNARVLGTSIRIVVDDGPKGSTRLEVKQGRVRLTRLDGKGVDVLSGHFAVAAAGVELAAKPLTPGKPRAMDLMRGMPPNSWISIPGTRMSDVTPKHGEFAGTWGIVGPASVIIAWSGGAFDTRRNQLLLWGGGGADYHGNEVYAFQVDSLSWRRLTHPTPNPSLGRPVNADGTPNGRATYNSLAYLTHADRFFACGGTLSGGPATDDKTWTFDPSARRWTDRNPPSTSGGGYSVSCSYDPGTRKVWWGSNTTTGLGGLWSYDYDANAWTRHNDDTFHEHTSAVDTRRGLLVVVGQGEVFTYDLRNADPRRRPRSTTGGEAFISRSSPGLDYDPVRDRVVGWAGGAVYSLDPETNAWIAHEAAAAPAPTENGMYGRWRYVPSLDAFIAVTGWDVDVHFYKPGRP